MAKFFGWVQMGRVCLRKATHWRKPHRRVFVWIKLRTRHIHEAFITLLAIFCFRRIYEPFKNRFADY